MTAPVLAVLNSRTRVILALDVPIEAQARTIVDALGDAVQHYKIGLQLLTAAGPALMRELVGAGREIFLDLKLFEIPNSVSGAVRAAGEQGVSMVTVHASAGSAILRAAVEAARPWPALKVLALTVVTSLRDADLREVGIEAGTDAQVLRLARLAQASGCHGVVASVHEAAMLRDALDARLLRIVPGIRPGIQPPGEGGSNQARTATPAQAIRAGATHIVLGRAVTQAADAQAVFAAVCNEVGKSAGHSHFCGSPMFP